MNLGHQDVKMLENQNAGRRRLEIKTCIKINETYSFTTKITILGLKIY